MLCPGSPTGRGKGLTGESNRCSHQFNSDSQTQIPQGESSNLSLGTIELPNKEIIGWAKIANVEILNTVYDHLDFVYVVPSHRGSNAIKLLLYGLKETSSCPIIGDGVLFKDGQRMMSNLLKQNAIFQVQILDKQTGKVEPFKGLVDDTHKCYLLKESGVGFGVQLLPPQFMKFSWYFSLRD